MALKDYEDILTALRNLTPAERDELFDKLNSMQKEEHHESVQGI